MIAEFRRSTIDALGSNVGTGVGYLPDDVAHLPCHVVGRPSIRESRTPGVMTITLDVTLLGRRISDEDAQQELDALADELFIVLGGTKNRKVSGHQLRAVTVNPGTVIVAGLECPAYIATVSGEIVSC